MSRSVLFVEETQGQSKPYARPLRTRGFLLVGTAVEHDVIRMAAREPPPVAIVIARSDAARVGAWRLARILRSAPRTRLIPIIALSEASSASSPVLAFAAGCTQFVAMPCTADELLVAIETACAPASRSTIRPA